MARTKSTSAFRVRQATEHRSIIEGEKHIVSVLNKYDANSLAALLTVAGEIDCPADQIVYAVAKSLGVEVRIIS